MAGKCRHTPKKPVSGVVTGGKERQQGIIHLLEWPTKDQMKRMIRDGWACRGIDVIDNTQFKRFVAFRKFPELVKDPNIRDSITQQESP